MYKFITYCECTPQNSLKYAVEPLREAGFRFDFFYPRLTVFYNTTDEFSQIESIMDVVDANCPYRSIDCPVKECHRKIHNKDRKLFEKSK